MLKWQVRTKQVQVATSVFIVTVLSFMQDITIRIASISSCYMYKGSWFLGAQTEDVNG